jgi:hypothetical protein
MPLGQILLIELAYGLACALTGAFLLWLVRPRWRARMRPQGRHSTHISHSPQEDPSHEHRRAQPGQDRIRAAG